MFKSIPTQWARSQGQIFKPLDLGLPRVVADDPSGPEKAMNPAYYTMQDAGAVEGTYLTRGGSKLWF